MLRVMDQEISERLPLILVLAGRGKGGQRPRLPSFKQPGTFKSSRCSWPGVVGHFVRPSPIAVFTWVTVIFRAVSSRHSRFSVTQEMITTTTGLAACKFIWTP